MDKDSINDMEQIQKGLEQFLQKEVAGYKDTLKQKSTNDSGIDMIDISDKDSQADEEEIDILISHTQAGIRQSSRTDREDNPPGKRAVPVKKKPIRESAPKSKQKGDKPPVKKKRKKKKSGFKKFLISLLVIIALLAGFWYYLVGYLYDKMVYREIEVFTSEPMKEEGVVNILLIGDDTREAGTGGRSDAIILLSINSKTKTIYMTSLLRDMYVEIPGMQSNRLNAAYSYGGPKLLMETVSQNLDITVNRYMLVNFQAFANLVDAVGGVDLDLTNEEVIYVNGYLVEYNILEGRAEGTDYLDGTLSGMIHLNGPQALAYCRNRYLGTDFGRTERQRKVLTEVISKLPKAIITNPSGMIGGLFPNLTTNLTQGECYQLSLLAVQLLSYDIVQESIPLTGTYKNSNIRGMSVLEVDFEANKKYIRTNIYGD